METLDEIQAVQRYCLDARAFRRIGFVPTMGCLHEGHLSLMRRARVDCELVVASIFVNPLQFGPDEDLERYPRDLARDSELCREVGVDLLFSTSPAQMYPEGYSTYVTEDRLGQTLCGADRPGHFRGVTTVVAKLFQLVLPHVAYFGQKDAQQAAIIERMARDLNFPIQIEILPIVREADGLALSSRNRYLSTEARTQALSLIASLRLAAQAFADGQSDARALAQTVRAHIQGEIDYVEIVSRQDFQPVETARAGDLLALAVRIGPTRLIDNLILGESP